jgi:hypothetical protein
VPRNSQAPLTRSGSRSTAEHEDQSIIRQIVHRKWAGRASVQIEGQPASGLSRSNAGLGSRHPNCGISAAMKHRQDNNAMLFCTKINAVWKTIGNNTPNVIANNGKPERMFRCERYTTVNLSNELKSEATSLTFIPHACFTKLCTGGTMKSD